MFKFGKFFYIFSAAVGLTAVSSAFILIPYLTKSDDQKTFSDSVAWNNFFKGQVKSERHDKRGVYVTSIIDDKELKYYLYNLKDGFDGKFSLPFSMTQDEITQFL